MALSISVVRFYKSLEFMIDPKGPHTYDNHRGHNMEDTFTLFNGSELLFTCKVQTVANMEGLEKLASFQNTIEPGDFYLKAFVDPRMFYGDIHGIVGARTLSGDLIDYFSITKNNPYRWLVHDTQKKRQNADGTTNPPGIQGRSAWSDGCFIMLPGSLEMLSKMFKKFGVEKGSLVPMSLKMEGTK